MHELFLEVGKVVYGFGGSPGDVIGALVGVLRDALAMRSPDGVLDLDAGEALIIAMVRGVNAKARQRKYEPRIAKRVPQNFDWRDYLRGDES